MDIDQIPEATWAVFTINSPAVTGHDETYARIQTEWFPTSHYKRMLDLPNLEVYPAGNGSSKDYIWEIWLPVIEK